MSNRLISVVLPVYNGSQYLHQSIQSILDQAHKNFELLIVDDCSTDSTPTIIAEFQARDSRIKSVRHETNKRLPGSLNTGLHLAAGDYVSWTLDDNLYKPDAFQEMAAILDKYPDIGFVYSDYDLIDENGEVTCVVSAGDWKMLGLTYVIGGSFLYRRLIHETVGYYDESTYLAEDLEFELRAMVNGFGFHPLHRNLYQYRDHPGSLTSIKSRQMIHVNAEVIRKYFPKMPWMSNEDKYRSFLNLAIKAFHNRDLAASFMYFAEGFRLSPSSAGKTLLSLPSIIRKKLK